SRLAPQTSELMDELAPHVAVALRNALTLKKVPAVGLWRGAGGIWESLHGKTLTKVLLAIAAALVTIAALSFVPYEYRLTAEGRLLPAQRQRIFAPWDGNIVDIMVESGQRVAAGAPLVRLENEELRQQLVSARNELEAKQQALLS